MFNLLQELHKNDVELKIDKASFSGTIIKVTLRSAAHCQVRYFDLEKPVMKEPEAIINYLHLFYKEFLEEKGRREYLAETLVSTYEQEQKDFLQERRKAFAENGFKNCLRPATDDPYKEVNEACRRESMMKCAQGVGSEEDWRIWNEECMKELEENLAKGTAETVLGTATDGGDIRDSQERKTEEER